MILSTIVYVLKARLTAYLLLGLTCFLLISQCQKAKQLEHQARQGKSRVSIATRIVKEYVDRNGLNHTVVVPAAVSRQQAKDFLRNDRYVNDTLVKALNIAREKISELTRINATLAGSSKGKPDEPGNALSVVRGSDRWMSWNYNPADTTLKWLYDLDLQMVGYSKRKKFLGVGVGEKVYYEDYFSADDRIKIKGVDRFTKAIERPTVALRLNGTGRFNMTTGQAYIGPGIEIDYRRVTLGGNYVYSLQADRWGWIIEPKFTLIRF